MAVRIAAGGHWTIPGRTGTSRGTKSSWSGLRWLVVVGDLRLLLDALEDVRVRLLLPLGQFVPVCDVSRFGVRKVFEDLADPAERDEPALLSAAELICSAVGGTDEGSHLVMDCSSTAALPVGRFVPRGDVGLLGLAGVVLPDTVDPCLAESPSSFDLQSESSS